MSAISGTRRQYKEMADGTLRVSIDIDPMFKAQFLELFGAIDMPVALAPLQPNFDQPKEEEKKGGPLAKSAAQMCAYPVFIKFMEEKYMGVGTEEDTAHLIRELCKIKSRSELDHNPEAAKRFHELMRQYREWNEGKAA